MFRRAVGPVFVVAGMLHFVKPDAYVSIMPDRLPAKRFLVYASGVAESVAGALATHPRTRSGAGRWTLLATLNAITPANVHMALHPERYPKIPKAVLWFRIGPGHLLWCWWIWAGTAGD